MSESVKITSFNDPEMVISVTPPSSINHMKEEPLCCFCGKNQVGFFDEKPPLYDEWCALCEVKPTDEQYQVYMNRRMERVIGARRIAAEVDKCD